MGTQEKICSNCDGSGYAPCQSCGGFGMDNYSDCENCSCSGEVECEECGGSGKIEWVGYVNYLDIAGCVLWLLVVIVLVVE